MTTNEWRVAALNILHGGGTRVPALIDRLLGYDADVLVLAEFRAAPGGAKLIGALRRAGYEVSHPDGGAHNAVLVASRSGCVRAWSLSEELERRRLWCVDVGGLVVCGVGMPNKHEKAPYWYRLVSQAHVSGVDLLIGDFNTGDNDLDKDPHGARFFSAEMPARLVATGYVDLWRSEHPGVRDYSWFSNAGNGFRIDHAYGSPAVAAALTVCEFDHTPRLLGETDHSALVVTFDRGRLPVGPLQPVPDVVIPAPTTRYHRPTSQTGGDWTRQSFVEAVVDPVDRAFLLRTAEDPAPAN